MVDIRSLQLIQLDMLKEVDRLCRKYDIKYFLSAGTLLGAVRHKGFIPWDDDIDINMPYRDYVKFCRICDKYLNKEKYFLQTRDTDKHHLYVFAKLRRNETLFLREGQEHMKFHQGIFIDIFPMFPVPKGTVLNALFSFTVARLKTIMWSPIGAKGNSRYKVIYKVLSLVPINIPQNIIYFLSARCKGGYLVDIGEPQYGNLRLFIKRRAYMGEKIKNIRRKLQVTNLIELEFEGNKFFAPKNFHYILTHKYGNYMKLPPKSKRVGHHIPLVIQFGNL